jgi:ATP-binding cassette, subfamily B, heavy metal transporter
MNEVLSTLKVFYGFVTRRWVWFSVFLTITITANALHAVVPYFYKLFADSLESQNYDELLVLLLLLVLVRFVALIANVLSYYTGDIVSFDASVKAKLKVFKHLQDLDFAFHTRKSTGSLISAIKRGDGAVWSLFHAIHHRFLEVLVSFVVMMFFVGRLDVRIAMVVFVSFLLSLLVTKYLVALNINARRRHNDEEDNISSIVVDNLVNFETVKLFSKEERELSRLKKAYKPWLKYGWKYVNTFRVIDLSIGSIVNISILLVLIYSLGLVREVRMGVGDFLLVFGFVNTFYPQLFELVYGYREIGKNYTDIEKYFKLLDNQIEIKDPITPIKLENVRGEVEFKNVTFSYEEGKKYALRNVSFNIRQGQTIALVGRSGSGKTTLVKLLLRFFDVDEGQITVDRIGIDKLNKSDLRSFMGVVPQEPILFNNTIEYNIAYGKDDVTKQQIEAAAKIANLGEFIETLPKKYKTNVGERGIKLSGGQKQRLAIARMILSDPDIIIFDEATSHLDSENERLIQEAFEKASKNKTTIIIAHRLSTAMNADKIIVLQNGKITEEGSHLSLLSKDKGIYRKLWDIQVNRQSQKG